MKDLLKEMEGFDIHASDGRIGVVTDFLVDDRTWNIRYLVVDTGGFFSRNEVLLSPISIEHVGWVERSFFVSLTREQVEKSPTISSDKPVTRKMEEEYFDHFGWPYYWGATPTWAVGPYGIATPPIDSGETMKAIRESTEQSLESKSNEEDEANRSNPHLISLRDTRGYKVKTTDQEIGTIEDFVVDEDGWHLPFVVVEATGQRNKRSVLIASELVDFVKYEDSFVQFGVDSGDIYAAPEYDPSVRITSDFSEKVRAHYGLSSDHGSPRPPSPRAGARSEPRTTN